MRTELVRAISCFTARSKSLIEYRFVPQYRFLTIAAAAIGFGMDGTIGGENCVGTRKCYGLYIHLSSAGIADGKCRAICQIESTEHLFKV